MTDRPLSGSRSTCCVDDCERVAYKHGICRRHWDAIPVTERVEAMIAATAAAHEASIAAGSRLQERARSLPADAAQQQGSGSSMEPAAGEDGEEGA